MLHLSNNHLKGYLKNVICILLQRSLTDLKASIKIEILKLSIYITR